MKAMAALAPGAPVSGRRVPRIALAIASLLLTATIAARRAEAAGTQNWEVTFALRVTSDSREKLGLRLALPRSSDDQRISDLEIDHRSLDAVITPCGHRGLFSAAYGVYASADDVEVLQVLPAV